ncbi:hypothetical protein JKP88DRAFT_321033 [Tribonema minus]|uniref:Uncharacterized protein n=1 Tax=Tribonema minus TaxID=303371 RepID=A0A835YY91_9STRA|nr:hypothetical protein JKP88DRAFT_321033 [Tribonema minus]
MTKHGRGALLIVYSADTRSVYKQGFCDIMIIMTIIMIHVQITVLLLISEASWFLSSTPTASAAAHQSFSTTAIRGLRSWSFKSLALLLSAVAMSAMGASAPPHDGSFEQGPTLYVRVHDGGKARFLRVNDKGAADPRELIVNPNATDCWGEGTLLSGRHLVQPVLQR